MQKAIHGTIMLFPFTLCISCSLAATPFTIEADRQRLGPGQSATLTASGTNGATPASNVNWSISATVSHLRSLPSPSSQLQTPVDPSSCREEVWTFRGQNPFNANDYFEANVAIGCPLGMTWHSVVGVEQGQASGSD